MHNGSVIHGITLSNAANQPGLNLPDRAAAFVASQARR